ncbi:MAG: tyrosine-type recombinase/integrase [Sporolactobacillus sp.]
MASFQKRGRTWQYTISHKPKPIRKGGFRTRKEAKVIADEIEAALNKGIVPQLDPVPFADYFLNWFKIFKIKVTDVTKDHYLYTHKAIKNYFSDKSIQSIKKSDYQLFLNDFGSTRSKETVEKVHTHVKSCVQDALEEHLINTDFTRKVTVFWTTPAKKPYEKHLNYFDSKRLMKELFKRLDKGLGYYLLLLALSSGLRYEELVGLTRDDFDFKQNTLNVDKTWGYKKSQPRGFGPTKNNSSVRVIKINPHTMNAFKKVFDSRPTNTLGLVFYSPSSKYHVLTNTNANKLLTKTLKELNIDSSLTVHGLRHTHASILLYKKATILYVSERLGHQDVQTTYKYYAHILKEMRQEDDQVAMDTFESMSV